MEFCQYGVHTFIEFCQDKVQFECCKDKVHAKMGCCRDNVHGNMKRCQIMYSSIWNAVK